MTLIYYILIIFCLLSSLFYSYFIIKFYFGWKHISPHIIIDSEKPNIKVSVVVAARNEAQNIAGCLISLINQSYPVYLTEIIIIDDNSDDNTIRICKELIREKDIKNIQLIELKNYNKATKKEAIKLGIEYSTSDIILTTDADCVLKPNWILNMVSLYRIKKYKLISGPVVYRKSSGLFHSFQLFDFLSLIVSGAGAIGAHIPFMCNAANMAFEKEAYNLVSGEHYDSEYASGDDIFLLHKIKKLFPYSIGFIKSKEAIVETDYMKTFKELFYQRIRWASKSAAYKDIHALFISFSVFLFNLMIVVTTLLCFFHTRFIPLAVVTYLLKTIVDFPLLYSIISFNERKVLLYHYLWVQLLYPLYISSFALLGLLIHKYTWKGRENVR